MVFVAIFALIAFDSFEQKYRKQILTDPDVELVRVSIITIICY